MKLKQRLSLIATPAVAVLLLFGLGGCSKELKMEWSCKGTTKNSMQCEIRNTGTAAGEACFDIVQVCKNGEHVASVCSGRIEPGLTETKVIAAFTPPIGWLETCMGTESRNKRVSER